MDAVRDAVDAFEHLVEQAEASSDHRPRADLAGYQLQALATTLGQLAGEGAELPPAVAGALEAVQGWLAELGTGLDEEEGRRLREKVGAYAVVAEDLRLDPDRLADLLARWDAATARQRPAERRGAAGKQRAADDGAAAMQECPVCGQSFRRVAKHMSSAHPAEWQARRG